jgi:PAS domain S-box-containing protein
MWVLSPFSWAHGRRDSNGESFNQVSARQRHLMQRAYKRLSVVTGFGLLLVLLIVNAAITRRQLAVQIQDQVQVARSRRVLYELSETESLLKDGETGQRGFLYTGDQKYLRPYTAAIGQVGAHIDALSQLTADNPRERARIPVLRDLAQQKINELEQTIALYKAGKFDEAKALVLSDAGLHYMDQIRLLVIQMQGDERSLDFERTNQYHASIQRTIQSIYLTSLMAAVGLILLTYYILRQIELRERYAVELRAREEWFRVTLTSIGDAVIATDPKGMVTFLNPVAETLTGRTRDIARGKAIEEVFPIFNEVTMKTAENPVNKVLNESRVVGLANHTVLRNVNGKLIPIEDSAAPIVDDRKQLLGVVLVFRDVTMERKSEDILRKTEKLAAAARLSATVAHEINNPLEAIFNLVYVAKTSPDASPLVVEQLDMAEKELERVAHITRQTLGFYRDTSVAEQVEFAPLIESVLNLYSHKLQAKNIRVERQFGNCPAIYAVPGELKQAISNLISNAADAVDGEGTITVRLECNAVDGQERVELMVEDDGPGVPAENRERIFEPFFTTKQDVGTGLGLWVTKGIVDRHGGTILLRTHNGNGTARGAAFSILLPVVSDGRGASLEGSAEFGAN